VRKHGAGRAGDELHGGRGVPACSGSGWGEEEEDEDEDEEECDALHGEGILPRGDQDRTNMSPKRSIEKAPLFSTELGVGAKGGGFRVALKGKYRCRIHTLNPKP
jgi:hypothetical protein